MRTDTTKELSSQRGVDFNQESLNLEPIQIDVLDLGSGQDRRV